LLAKQPEQRYASAADVAEALAAIERPTTQPAAATRRPALFVALAGVAAAALLGIAFQLTRNMSIVAEPPSRPGDGTQVVEQPATVPPQEERAASAAPRRQPRVLMIVPSRDFNYAEVDPVRNQLGMYNVAWRIASTTLEACQAQKGGPPIQVPVKPDLLLADAKAADFDAIYFCGGRGSEEYTGQGKHSTEARRVIDEALAAKCTVAAMSNGVVILAEADVLRDRRAACYPYGEAPGVSAQRIEARGGICSERSVVEDGPFLTGRVTPDVKLFSRALLKRLGIEPLPERPPSRSN
jgi:putative intracellular protease/amidase